MYYLALAVQYIGIIGLFVEGWLVLKSWKDSLRAYLFFGCVASLVNNLGYLLEMKARNGEAYLTALQLSYSGRVWIGFSLFLFAFELCGIKIPRMIIRVLVLIQVGIYVTILTLQHHRLYYYDTDFILDGQLPVFVHKNGVVHSMFFLLQGIYIILGITVLIVSFVREKKKAVERRLFMVILAMFIESVFFLVQVFQPIEMYDLTMIGSILGTVIMFVSIFKFNLLGTKDIARDFMVDRLSEGVIAVDNDGEIQYFNEPAKELYPKIETNPGPVIESVRKAILHGRTIQINDRIFTPEENDLRYEGESFGKLFVLIDATEHYNRLKKQQKILRRELLTDPLTGFYNRKGMEYYATRLYQEVLNGGKVLFLCIADMNGLKYINDNFGHDQGDRAITELSKIIREALKEGDMAFRIGGDEFLLIGASNGSEHEKQDFADRIEALLKHYNETSNLPYKIDMSYGPIIARLKGDENELDSLIQLSDAKMYEMKRNRDAHLRK